MLLLWLLVAILCFIFGLYQILAAMRYLFYVFKLLRNAIHTVGRVINYSEKRPYKNANKEYFLVIHFNDNNGKSVSFMDWQAEYHPPILELNKEVKVIYHQDRPEYAAIDDFWHLWIIPGHSLLLGLASFYIANYALEKFLYLWRLSNLI
ncbi:MAG: DUF3592 domain-containing protein [Alphaproteobacteria bacterium]